MYIHILASEIGILAGANGRGEYSSHSIHSWPIWGFYECVHMPFGLTNAPTTFQQLMESCLGELHLQQCIINLDDIIIFARSVDEHLDRLRNVFAKLEQAKPKAKAIQMQIL